MPEERLESVEAALSAPKNQPPADALSALAPLTPSAKAPGAAEGGDALSALADNSGLDAKPFDTGLPSSLGAQYRKMVETAANTARSLRGRNGGMAQSDATRTDALRSVVDSLLRPAQPGASPAAPVAPPQPQIAMVSPQGGGKPYPTYSYGGMTVLLGDDVDVNDQAAVSARMNETNELIDMMNEAYA